MSSKPYKCRKCRTVLFQDDSVMNSHGNISEALHSPEEPSNCKDDKTVVYLNEQTMPKWMNDHVDIGEWLKGRLVCPNARCNARIGSFDFISGSYCSCSEHELPSIRMIRSKIDEPVQIC